MMAAKVPAPKMHRRAILSFAGRFKILSVLSGNTKIQISVTMLIPEVASLLISTSRVLKLVEQRTHNRKMLWY